MCSIYISTTPIHPLHRKCNSPAFLIPIPHVSGIKYRSGAIMEGTILALINLIRSKLCSFAFCHIVSKVSCFIAMVNIQALNKKKIVDIG
jgi:hypothetical protein